VVHAVKQDDDVPPEALAAAPEPGWTTDIPENWTAQAWAAHLRGDGEWAAEVVARLDVEGFRPEQEEVFRRVQRRRLREPLDGKPAAVRLREVVYRWARAAAADLDRGALRTEHAAAWHEARR
jgi:hypothetical protein